MQKIEAQHGNYLEHPPIRQWADNFATIILELQNRDSGHIARMIGLHHLGHPEYYNTIRDLLEDRSSKIIAESVDVPAEVDPQNAAAVKIQEHTYAELALHRLISEATNGEIVMQQGALILPQERVIHGDLNFDDFTKQVADVGIEQFNNIPTIEILGEKVPAHLVYRKGMDNWFFHYFAKAKVRNGFHRSVVESANTVKDDAFMVDKRNNQVTATIQRESADADVDVPWGSAHIPGIVNELLASEKWDVKSESIAYLTFYSRERVRGWLDRYLP